MPAAVANFRFDSDFLNEFLFGAVGFWKKWRSVQPNVRAFVGGMVATSDDEKHGASAVGIGVDWRRPCAAGQPGKAPPCPRLRLGASGSADLIMLWTQPRRVFPRFQVWGGLRWEGGRHRH
jgi:hypothetical protein